MRVLQAVSVVALLALFGAASPSPDATQQRLAMHPCSGGDSKVVTMCGTFVVPEDRAVTNGRTIALHFVLIKADHASQHVLAFNPGGPGGPATADAAAFIDDHGPFRALRDDYDVLLLDNRGTGRSAPQQCEFVPPAHPELYFRQLWPDSLVKACRDRLAPNADLNLYSTAVAADDLDDLRAALGYPKLALFGGSYGTFFYLAYARAYPDHVESMILDGVAPPHFYIIPLPVAAGAQASMNGLIAACAADTSCARHFPNFKSEFNALVARFDGGPILVPVRNAVTHQMQTVQLTKEVFVETIRHVLYFPGASASLPVVVDRAYHRNYLSLASVIDQTAKEFANILDTGLNLSVTCAEDNPFIREDDIVRTSAGSFEGDARVRAQQRACAIWNVRPVPASFIDPVKTDLPILMISGSDDAASPPAYARQALPFLPNARIMLVKGASHDSDYPPCVYQAMVTFLRANSAAGIDLDTCAATYHRPPFATLTYYESAPGENTAVTARTRAIFEGILAGRIDRSRLTPAVSKMYSDAVVKQGGAELSSGLGEIESFVYRNATHVAEATTYTYLAHGSLGNAIVKITITARGKVAGLDVSPA